MYTVERIETFQVTLIKSPKKKPPAALGAKVSAQLRIQIKSRLSSPFLMNLAC